MIVALFFFFIIGLGISMAAHLNAALAEDCLPDVKEAPAGAAAPATA